jgi:hypothetical protein
LTLFRYRQEYSCLFLSTPFLGNNHLHFDVLRWAPIDAGARSSALVAALFTLGGATAARAQDWSATVIPEPSQFRREMWAGADATSQAWSAYSGVTLAPFGPIGNDGWRLRVVGGYGAYRYGATPHISGNLRSQSFRGTVSFADVLLGYQKQYSTLTLKVFAGLSAADHQLTPFDAENTVSGFDHGFKGMVEAWLDMSARNWAALNVAWSSVEDTYTGRLRLGFTVWPELSLGLEGAATGSDEYGSGRGGALVRYTWGSGEISASGGPLLDSAMTLGAYGTLNVLTRF